MKMEKKGKKQGKRKKKNTEEEDKSNVTLFLINLFPFPSIVLFCYSSHFILISPSISLPPSPSQSLFSL